MHKSLQPKLWPEHHSHGMNFAASGLAPKDAQHDWRFIQYLNRRHKKTAWQGGFFNNISRSSMHRAIDAINTQAGSVLRASPRHLMSTREVAELTGKSHDNVMRDARSLAKRGVLKSEETPYVHPQNGQSYAEFLLSQRDALVLVSGYSAELRAKIIDRWQELEARVVAQVQIPTNFAEALRLAADKAEENQRLQDVLAKQAPKVAAINRLAGAGGAICITDAAKQLQLAPSRLFAWLEQNRWIYRRAGSTRWIAFQPRITAGLLRHKVTSLRPDLESGGDRATFSVLVTTKGLTYLAEKNIGGAQAVTDTKAQRPLERT
ncbi:phage antirepressor KilAC domain-containing protein [Pseudomonas phoenicis]|uniref:phage antirepressor KilAC domain-containing protein n=1 Tax=unclassified Pseudomonas TaxID=196821 RepID=UPI0039A1580A